MQYLYLYYITFIKFAKSGNIYKKYKMYFARITKNIHPTRNHRLDQMQILLRQTNIDYEFTTRLKK